MMEKKLVSGSSLGGNEYKRLAPIAAELMENRPKIQK